MTDRIDHAAEARLLMDITGDSYVTHEGWTETTALMATLDAQTHATLALVEQQRIANLIALSRETFAAHEACEALGTFATAKHGDQIGLRPDIAAALGIETGAGDE